MKVVREPRDAGVEALAHPLGQTLADAAERSDVIRPDQDSGARCAHVS
jgi:hypothetical protein